MPTDAKRQARIELIASAGGIDKGLHEASRKLRRFGRDVEKIDKVGKKRKGKSGMLGAGIVGGAAALAGGGLLGALSDAAGETRTFERNLLRLQIAGNRSTGQMDSLRSAINRVSRDTGVARGEILEGTQSYVDLTGDIAGAEAAMSTFAKAAVATGASVSDIASVAAALREAGVEAADFEGVMAGMHAQGKAGAVAFSNFAKELSSILPRWAQFNEGTTSAGIAQMGASFQIARKGFGSASEAATGLEALMGSLVTHSKQIKKHLGVDVFDKKGKLKTFDQIIDAINTSKKAGTKNIASAFGGNKEALQTLDMLRRAKNEATATGNAYSDMAAAGLQRNEIDQDYRIAMESSTMKLDRAMAELKIKIAEAFTPERIAKFVDIVGELVKGLGYVIDKISWIRDQARGKDKQLANPFEATSGDKLLDQEGKGWVAASSAFFGVGATANDLMGKAAGSQQRLKDLSKQQTPEGKKAREQLANQQAYAATMAKIQSAAADKRVEEAVAATYAPAGTSSYEGTYTAGERYLRYELGDDRWESERQRIRQGQVASMQGTVDENSRAAAAVVGMLIPSLSKAMSNVRLEVKLDGSTVAKVIENAPAQPPRPR